MKTESVLLSIGIILCLAASIFCGIVVVYRRKIRHEMEIIIQRLDDALCWKEQSPRFNETLDSAISERLDKFVRMQAGIRNQTQEEIATIKALVSDVSHQLKTPLANIMLYTAILQEKVKRKEEKELAEKVMTQTEKLEFFVHQLVQSSFAEIEMVHVIPEVYRIEELLSMVCQNAELSAFKKHICMKRQHTELSAVFDMKWTVEGIGNILDNAIKYSPEYSCIRINVTDYDSFVCVQIIDEGIGIREEEQGLVFQRFYRSAEVKEQEGIGIGLYLAREILVREGGYIKIRSSKGGGAAFQIFLPKY